MASCRVFPEKIIKIKIKILFLISFLFESFHRITGNGLVTDTQGSCYKHPLKICQQL